MTTTYALLPISASAYTEIKHLLEAAGYQHLLAGDRIVMDGIGLVAKEEAHPSITPSALTDWEQSNEGPWRTVGVRSHCVADSAAVPHKGAIERAFK